MDQVIENFTKLMAEYKMLAPLIVFVGGVLTSFSPCCLSSLPLIIGYVGGSENKDTKRAFKLSLVFVIGSSVTFTILGTIASLMGKIMNFSNQGWYVFLGILMLLMALQTWEVINVIPSTYFVSKNKKTGYAGAFITGILGGLFSSPCSTPVLIAILAIIAGQGSVVYGILLMVLYSLGNGILSIVAGTSVTFVKKLSSNNKYGIFSKLSKYIMGLVILILGFYLLYLGF